MAPSRHISYEPIFNEQTQSNLFTELQLTPFKFHSHNKNINIIESYLTKKNVLLHNENKQESILCQIN